MYLDKSIKFVYNRDTNKCSLVEFTFLALWNGVDFIRADYIKGDNFAHILSALMPPNRLALIVSLTTGLRIDDVLSLKTEDVKKERFTIKEMKTGKRRRIRLQKSLRDRLLQQSGRIYVFEHRLDYKKHRTRQAVNKDLKRACELFRVKGVHVSPHSARKIYAVEEYKRTCSLKKVQELLNHSDEAVTILYAMADELTAKEQKRQRTSVSLPDF